MSIPVPRRRQDGPGAYMRARRLAAGKTIAQCGEEIAALGHGPMAAHTARWQHTRPDGSTDGSTPSRMPRPQATIVLSLGTRATWLGLGLGLGFA